MNAITDWWQQLAPRERLMVSVCGVFIVFALFWSMIVQPLYAGSAKLEQQVSSKQSQLANLQELASQVTPASASRGAPAVASGESIVVIIDQTTRNNSLAPYLKRNQPEGDAAVRLRFEGAPFDSLVTWLGNLNSKYGMVTVSANFDEAGQGRVNCSLVLSRAGS